MKAGKISYPGVGVTVGGVIGFLGVLVGWFSYSYPLDGGTATVTLSGTADWTGAGRPWWPASARSRSVVPTS